MLWNLHINSSNKSCGAPLKYMLLMSCNYHHRKSVSLGSPFSNWKTLLLYATWNLKTRWWKRMKSSFIYFSCLCSVYIKYIYTNVCLGSRSHKWLSPTQLVHYTSWNCSRLTSTVDQHLLIYSRSTSTYLLNTPLQVGAWMLRMFNLLVNFLKLSPPKALVNISASWRW
jgi:hypothetical protein